jgi:hypothetical protein
MDTLLQLMLAVALVIALLAGGAVWLWRCKIKRLYGWSLAASILPAPARLQLIPSSSDRSRKEERVAQRQAALRELGFADLGVLDVTNVPGLRLFVLHHPPTGMVAMVEERDCTGTWSDVMQFDPAGEEVILASNAHRHFHFYFLPGERRMHKPDAPERELVEAVLGAERPPSNPPLLTLEQFIPLLERAYARRMDSLLLDGFEDADIRRLLRDAGNAPEEALSPGELAEIKRSLQELADNALRAACASEFARSNALPAAEWHRSRERLLVVHDRTPLPLLKRRFILEAFLTDALKRSLPRTSGGKLSPRDAFAKLNASLPSAHRYKRLGQVNSPVAADIYRAPLAPSLT